MSYSQDALLLILIYFRNEYFVHREIHFLNFDFGLDHLPTVRLLIIGRFTFCLYQLESIDKKAVAVQIIAWRRSLCMLNGCLDIHKVVFQSVWVCCTPASILFSHRVQYPVLQIPRLSYPCNTYRINLNGTILQWNSLDAVGGWPNSVPLFMPLFRQIIGLEPGSGDMVTTGMLNFKFWW